MGPLTECVVFICEDPAKPIPIASFGLDVNGDGHFGYGLRYIEREDAFSIDPLHLPLDAKQQMILRHQDGSYGVLSDAGPNAWGVRLTSSILRKENKPLPTTPVEWFLQSWHYGSGCLGFSVSSDIHPDIGVLAAPVNVLSQRLLSTISQLAVKIDTDLDEEAVRLMQPGASLGGVRPKTVVMNDGFEHIAKFSRADDKFDVPTAEYATMQLAFQAGINVPNFELLKIADKSVLLIERFDRTKDGHRLHYMSAKSLINIDVLSSDQREYKTKYSYAGIAETMRPRSKQGVADSHELFRRMVLNILVGNVDDHMRNHAFLMTRQGKFVLSPAFDIVPHMDAMSLPQAIGVGAQGAASTMRNALSQCGRFLLTTQEAQNIIHKVREVVSRWRHVFKEAGMEDTDIHTLTPCFSAADASDRIHIAVTRDASSAENNRPPQTN
ncbi:type II toxin-antitoxin system HipA family toxin [Glaciimonas sp. GNP009]